MKLKSILIILITGTILYSCSGQGEKKYQPVSVVQHPQWSLNKTIYEVNLRQFSSAGTFKGLQEKLPQLKELGVGIIWLMPIHPIGEKNRKGTLGSPYAVKDYLAINPDLGSEEDFRELVKTVHEQGMFVILDWVANHSAWDNALTETHPQFYLKDSLGNFVPPNKDWHDVIDFDYNNPEMRTYMIDVMKHWVYEFDIDGYRCDVAYMVPLDFWDAARRELELIKPVFMLAEAEEVYMHNRAFDMTYSWQIFHALNDIAQGKESVTKIDKILNEEKRIYPPSAFRMRFTSNHDENANVGSAVERLGDAVKTAAVLTATLPGKPMIYNGQEVGLDKRLPFFEKDSIDWRESTFRNFYSRLLNLYQENPALYMGEMVKISPADERAVYAFARIKEQYKVVVILNFSAEQKKIELESDVLPGSYVELFSNVPLTFEQSRVFDLEPWAYRVFAGDIKN